MVSVAGGGAGSWPLLWPARGIMELCGARHRKWSRAAMAAAACQGMMILRGVRHRRWSRVAAILRACQGAWICRLKLGNGRSRRERSPAPVGVRAELF